MKRNLGILLITMIFITVLSSCEKKEILELKTVWGEATINNYWCPVKLSSLIWILFSSDSRCLERIAASYGDKNPLKEPELSKYGILVNKCLMKEEYFCRTAYVITEIWGLSIYKNTQNSRLNTFSGHQ